MARFLGWIKGQSGNGVSRCGSSRSGIQSQINGWNTGVEINGRRNDDDLDYDIFTIYKTGGSNDQSRKQPIARLLGNDLQIYMDGAWRDI